MAKKPRYIKPKQVKIVDSDDDEFELNMKNMKLKRRIKLNITDKLKSHLRNQVIVEQKMRNWSQIHDGKKEPINIGNLFFQQDSRR